ncbi:MAG: sialate O-acetylesterase [Bacteroidales bacterium]
MKKATILLLFVLLASACQKGPSNLKLPALLSDNMLLQQKADATFWGKANPGQKISVTPSWGEKKTVRTGKDGKWSVKIATPEAGGPYKIIINAVDTTITINDVLVGEVWVCSGQSNMEMPVQGWPPVDTIMYSAKTIASAVLPNIRLFNVARKVSTDPLDDCTGRWEVCNPETIKSFSATGFFFGKKLYEKLNVPIGLIESAWGGTPSESWTSADVLTNAGEFVKDIATIKESLPLQAQYKAFLEGHKKLEIKPAGDNQWKNLSFDDEAAASADFNDSAWPVMNLPAKFESVIGEFDGAVWFRRNVNIPESFKGKGLILSLGPIDDMDCTYFNGKVVGSTEVSGYWQVSRNYEIPAGLVKAGPNSIAIRVLDTQGNGGIWGQPGSMKISIKNGKQQPVDISGEWKYQPAAELAGNMFYLFDITKNEYSGVKKPIALGPNLPALLYNGMINPIINYRIRGAVWYQGEANVGRADQYAKIFPLMIRNWRDAWNEKNFPFYFVQIAPYVYSGVDSTESVLLREAQAKSLATPNTGMVVTLDIATVMDIHPPYKMDVGNRLAALALNNDYGIKTPCAGPVYKSMATDGNVIKVQFENTGSGLISKNDFIPEFEIAGKDGAFVKAVAKIVNNEVWVSSPNVAEPAMVRYCWRNGAVGSLFNSDGLPASEFSAGK